MACASGESFNGQEAMEREIKSLGGKRATLLLHACCGPCASAALERVLTAFDATAYYFNPNIEPREEYLKRLDTLRALLTHMAANGARVQLIEGEYAPERFREAAKGLECAPEGGARCERCFALRLNQTAAVAKARGFAYFGTTLTVGPHKNAALINRLGEDIAQRVGIRWLPADFKKKDGYKRSLELSKQYNLYRQTDCGCVFSRRTDDIAPSATPETPIDEPKMLADDYGMPSDQPETPLDSV